MLYSRSSLVIYFIHNSVYVNLKQVELILPDSKVLGVPWPGMMIMMMITADT